MNAVEAEVVVNAEPAESETTKKTRAIAKRQTQQIAEVVQPAQPVTIEQMIMRAMEMDKPELIDKFVAIYEKQEAERKKAAFTAAMSRAQARIVPIAANAVNLHTHSRYAKRDAICKAIAPIYGEEGLAISFRPGKAERQGDERVYAVISHKDGYIDDSSYYIDLPRDNKGAQGNTNKTELHAIGSTREYARRYLTLDVFNVAIGEEDDDGNKGAGVASNRAHKQVSQPKQTPTAQKQQEQKKQAAAQTSLVDRQGKAQLIPVNDNTAIDANTKKVVEKRMETATLGLGDFKARFPAFNGFDDPLVHVSAQGAQMKVLMDWLQDPQNK